MNSNGIASQDPENDAQDDDNENQSDAFHNNPNLNQAEESSLKGGQRMGMDQV